MHTSRSLYAIVEYVVWILLESMHSSMHTKSTRTLVHSTSSYNKYIYYELVATTRSIYIYERICILLLIVVLLVLSSTLVLLYYSRISINIMILCKLEYSSTSSLYSMGAGVEPPGEDSVLAVASVTTSRTYY